VVRSYPWFGVAWMNERDARRFARILRDRGVRGARASGSPVMDKGRQHLYQIIVPRGKVMIAKRILAHVAKEFEKTPREVRKK
jgi:hypothetical protein